MCSYTFLSSFHVCWKSRGLSHHCVAPTHLFSEYPAEVVSILAKVVERLLQSFRDQPLFFINPSLFSKFLSTFPLSNCFVDVAFMHFGPFSQSISCGRLSYTTIFCIWWGREWQALADGTPSKRSCHLEDSYRHRSKWGNDNYLYFLFFTLAITFAC